MDPLQIARANRPWRCAVSRRRSLYAGGSVLLSPPWALAINRLLSRENCPLSSQPTLSENLQPRWRLLCFRLKGMVHLRFPHAAERTERLQRRVDRLCHGPCSRRYAAREREAITTSISAFLLLNYTPDQPRPPQGRPPNGKGRGELPWKLVQPAPANALLLALFSRRWLSSRKKTSPVLKPSLYSSLAQSGASRYLPDLQRGSRSAFWSRACGRTERRASLHGRTDRRRHADPAEAANQRR